MGTRDALPGEPESVGAIWASDHFIEQLQANGTYEPTSRIDAALAASLVAWRDDVREAPISPPPTADDVVIDPRPMIQPRRIARRAVAVAGVLLAMSSAMATALDADPLKPVRYLVDLGVTVGERISDPVNDPSAEEAPSPSDGEGDVYGEADVNGMPPTGPPIGGGQGQNPDDKALLPGDSPATDGEAEEIDPTADPTAGSTDGGDQTDADTSTGDPSAQPTESDETETPATSDPSTDPTAEPSTDPTTEPTSTPPPAQGDGGENGNPQDPPAPAPDVGGSDLSGGGNPNGVADPDAGIPDAASGDDAYGDQSFADDSYGEDDGYGFPQGDGREPLGPNALPSIGLPLDFNQGPEIYRHEDATHGQGFGRHDATMGGPAEIHRGDAWKSQVLMFLTRLPRSD
jgi:hypothetical protein